jgi:Ni,Fe-hydrogenase III small subunit/ferredoxin-like protein FixX
MWALRVLRNGVLTTRWPARPDNYATATRGPAIVLPVRAAAPVSTGDLAQLCPARAISQDESGRVRLDQGGCISCGRCVAARPDVFGWSAGPDSASLSRTGLVVPPDESPESLAVVTTQLRERTRALRRSVHLRHADAGSDGSEEWEIMALLNPVYDIHRLGMFFTASPRHADILLVTGSGAHGMVGPLRLTYDAMPHPKVVIAVGTDAVGGGIASPSYATSGGIGGIVPVDVWLPGSPPSPFAILSALLLAVGRLPDEKPGRNADRSPLPDGAGDQR